MYKRLLFLNKYFLDITDSHKKIIRITMRILTIGFEDEFVKQLEVELEKYFICIVDSAKDLYDATNFTDFRHYELIIIVDENQKYSLEKYLYPQSL